MKKILIWGLILVLVAVTSVVGTLAYLTATDEVTNVMTVDDARIKILEYERVDIDTKNDAASVQAFNDNKPLIPSVVPNAAEYSKLDNSIYAKFDTDNAGNTIKAGYTYPIWNPEAITNEIDKMVFVKNTGDCNVYIRLCFAFEAGNYVRLDRFKQMVHLNLNTTDWDWDWNETRLAEIDGTRCFIAWATYKYPVAPGELTDISLAQIALDYTAINDHARAFGDTYDVKVFAQGIQSDGFATANAALTKGFDDTIPFKNVKFLELTDLKTAINKAGDLNTVTFGLTADHAKKVEGIEGVFTVNLPTRKDWYGNLITEADFTAYTYHVPAGNGLYDVYVLADNWKICAPNDCVEFFNYKRRLTKVDATNLDVSATTKMAKMFFECDNLKEVDVSNWDVSNVTEMQGMFQGCESLETLDVSKWDVGNVTKMSAMFDNCSSLEKLDVSNWYVGNVTGMNHMFNSCGKINNLDVSNWEVDNVTEMQSMFLNCYNLSKLDCSRWNVDNVTNMNQMFQNCQCATALDLSGWNVSKVTNMAYMFSGCDILTSLDIAGWRFVSTDENGTEIGPSVTTMNYMFSECSKLKSLDLSGWNVSIVTDMACMFNLCSALESLNVSTWNVSSVTSMLQMFKGCTKLTDLDVSSWDVSKVNNMQQTFSDCYSLTTLDLSRWNVSNVTIMNKTFSGCGSLTTLDLSGWDVSKVTDMTQMFYSDSALTTIYAGADWNVDNVTLHNQMFTNCTNLPGFDSGKVDKTGAKLTTSGGYFTEKK